MALKGQNRTWAKPFFPERVAERQQESTQALMQMYGLKLSYKQTFGLPDGTFQSLLTLVWGGTQGNSKEKDRTLGSGSVKQM